MKDFIYSLPFKVRDYECDLQGIVNNANYQHYLEHTRHEFIESEGINFAALHAQGIDVVVARIDIAYKTPLRSGDHFVCRLRLSKESVKYVFHQTIRRLPDNALCIKARVDTVALVGGKLAGECESLDRVLGKYV